MRRAISAIARGGAAIAIGLALVAAGRRAMPPPDGRPAGDGPPEARPGAGTASRRARHWLRHALVVLAALAVLGFLGVVSGIVPFKASAGHWAITRWFLNFAMARSVAMYSLAVSAPSLDEPWLVLKGAGHYEYGCRPCHGSPEQPRPKIALAMTPYPPYLPPVVAEWDAEELFYIVKHGVKFTGMPAWPAPERDDEVWAVVAFLRALPGLDAAAYARLVRGDEGAEGNPVAGPALPHASQPPAALAASCAACHGADGNGRGLPAFPRLAGQRPAYLLASLEAFARGERRSGIMEPIAAALDPAARRELAAYYAGLPARAPASAAPTPAPATAHAPRARVAAAAREGGEAIVRDGIPAQRVPPCAACHGPGTTPRNPVYPQLAGQYAEYLALQLDLFKRGVRGGTPYGHIMQMVAGRLTPEQMRAAAAHYASLPPARAPGDPVLAGSEEVRAAPQSSGDSSRATESRNRTARGSRP